MLLMNSSLTNTPPQMPSNHLAVQDEMNTSTPRIRKLRLSSLLLIIGALIFIAPVLAVLFSLLMDSGDTQHHIWTTIGPSYLLGTLGLCFFVALIAGFLGVSTAALISLTQFPGRRFFSLTLILPFAVPAYIAAYCYADFLSPFGFFAQTFTNGTPFTFLNIRNFWGAVFILCLTVYPYVYLAVRADLSSRAGAMMQAAQTLGARPAQIFWQLLLPTIRPALFGGLALAMMETAADFGVSEYFGVQTLSTGIFRTWYNLGNLTAAAQIAGGLFILAALLLLIEDFSRPGETSDDLRSHRIAKPFPLTTIQKLSAILFCTIPVFLGFILPVLILLAKINTYDAALYTDRLWVAVKNTNIVAVAGSFGAIVLAISLAHLERRRGQPWMKLFIRIVTMGYSIPGAVIAVGILFAGAALLKPLDLSITSAGILLLIYAYILRFLTAGYNLTAGGLKKINPQIDMAARNLGANSRQISIGLHWPLANRSILAGFIIIFIDITRELPATLLLRPFNFETLATLVYRLASDERLDAAAPMALTLILAGLIPVYLLHIFSHDK